MSKMTIFLLILLLLLQLYDVGISYLMGFELEANPIGRFLWAHCGLGVVTLLKVCIWLAMALLAVLVETDDRLIRIIYRTGLLLANVFLLLVCINNTLWVVCK